MNKIFKRNDFGSIEAENFFKKMVISSIGDVERALFIWMIKSSCENDNEVELEQYPLVSVGDTKAHWNKILKKGLNREKFKIT